MGTSKLSASCPSKGEGWDEKEFVCIQCCKDYPKDYEECRIDSIALRQSKTNPPSEQKAEAPAEPEPAPEPIQEEQPKSTEGKEVKEMPKTKTDKKKARATRKDSHKAKMRALLDGKKTLDEKERDHYKKLLAKRWTEEGKDEKYAMSRAASVLRDICKEMGIKYV